MRRRQLLASVAVPAILRATDALSCVCLGGLETSEATIITTVGPTITASQTMRQASNGPFNTFQLTSGGQILVNGATTGSNVTKLAYHQHTAFQYANRTTSDDWWYWNTTAAAWYYFVISGVTLTPQTWAQGDPAGTVIANIAVAMSANAANDTFSTFTGGQLTLTANADLVISGSNIVVANGHTATLASYSVTVAAAFPVGGQNIGVMTINPTNTVTQTLNAGTAEGTYPFLMGFMQGGLSGTYTSVVGLSPDFENNGADGTYVGPDGANGNYGNWRTDGFPVVFQTSHIADSNNPTSSPYTNPTTAANGGYNTVYQGLINNVGSFVQYIYCIRIDWEWAGAGFPFSPFATSNIGSGSTSSPWYSAQTFIAGWRQMVDTLRAATGWSNVKIMWDYPLNWGGGVDPLAFYPAWPTSDPIYGATSLAAGGSLTDKTGYVDIIGDDPYFGWFDGGTSAASWSFRLNGSFGLTALAQFAAARGKVIAFMEWGDGYNDGVCIDNFANWCKNTVPTLGTKVVFLSWFNAGNGNGTDTFGALGDDNLTNPNKPIRLQHYISNFGSTAMGTNGYTGTYWTHKSNSGTRPPGL